MEAGRSESTPARADHDETGRPAHSDAPSRRALRQPAQADSRAAGRLDRLDGAWHVLADRRVPGSAHARIDFVVAGPGGVFVVDVVTWREAMLQGDRLFRGQEDVTDEVASVASLARLTAAALAETGLVPHEVRAVAVVLGLPGMPFGGAQVAGVDIVSATDLPAHLAGRGRRIVPEAMPEILAILEDTFAPETDDQADSLDVVAPRPGVVRAPIRPADLRPVRPAPHPALFTVEQLDELAVRSARAQPVESWMTFLHPRQLRATTRRYSGPSRIRGAAGTGKTVVGLHRAVHLAGQRRGRVLVTAYVRTLPKVLSELLRRLSPENIDLIDCRSVFEVAVRVLSRAGIANKVDARQADQAFSQAWRLMRIPTGLSDIDPSPAYWRDEIDHVIKGRGIVAFEEYRDLDRLGRRRGLDRFQRAAVWALRDEYEAELHRRGIWDWADVMIEATRAAATLPREYSAVVVDEAQDLSCQTMRFLHTLAGDAPDALTIIGDGQQSIYPGGFTLREAGVNVTGRAIVLNENLRNTREIFAAARSLTAGDRWMDIDGVESVGDPAEAHRHGAKPTIVRHTSEHAVDDAIVARVAGLIRAGHRPGDIAVLALYRAEVRRLSARLRSGGIPTVLIEDYTGTAVDAVKVGTVKRAKGLEFSQVIVAHAPARLVDGRKDDEDLLSSAEIRALQRRELYVAMTRARDGLWVGVRDDTVA